MSDRPIKVMVVDDEVFIRKTIGQYLQLHDINVMLAEDGDDALQKAIAFEPDLIVIDLMMKNTGGLDLCCLLKMEPSMKNIPTIICSAHLTDNTKNVAKSIGVNDFLLKPFEYEELLKKILTVLGKKSSSIEVDS